ncbi:Transient receptor potential cation channel subfamily A member 1 [Pteropus alecto]|uniref:Transient receptor potential cation channel subfamily A member 1 n=1 Tax=Pteropus alecto TaxID=9402 RepID=L5JVS2_PTEAL|nr:Transient receptor potential cation channel subfamily A member 1 [Pteropus alecto]
MKRSLRRMLRPAEKAPADVVYQGVEDGVHHSRDSFQVVFEGGASELHHCMKKQKKLRKYDDVDASPLHHAAEEGQVELMEMIVSDSPCEVLNVTDNYGNSPLHWAAVKNQAESVKFLLSKGANPNLQNSSMMAPLHLAVQGGHNEVVKVLTEHSSTDTNLEGENGNTALLIACFQDNSEALQMLGADINSTDSEGRSPLLLATASASWNIVNLLLSKGAHVDIKDHLGRNFLHLTVQQPYGLNSLRPEFMQMQHIKELVMDEDNDGCTPLHYACRQGVPISVNNLLNFNVSIHSKSKDKKSPLHFAASYGRINTCQRLLQDMSDTRLLNEGDLHGMTPLHLAAKNGHDKVVQLLLKKGALFVSDHNGWTALHHASLGGYTQTMKVILDTNLKSTTDQPDEEGNTALHLAAREGHAKAVALLLSYDADVVLNKHHASFLHFAIHNKRKEVVLTTIRSKRAPGTTNRLLRNLLRPPGVETSSAFLVGPLQCAVLQIEYNFRYLQWPLECTKQASAQDVTYEPLTTLNKSTYFLDNNNVTEWIIYTTSIIFVSPLFVGIPAHVQWQCGAVAIHLYWMNFLLYLQRFENCGIFIVMLEVIMKTLLRSTVVFVFLLVAFGLSFYVLLSIQIGLAVGDIAEVQKHALLKRIAMQVELHTNLEKKLPLWFLRQVDQSSIIVYPNRPRCGGRILRIFHFLCRTQDSRQEIPNVDTSLEVEILKQKYRMKDLTSLVEKQHELIKLIIQKMEIISETEDEDNHSSFQDRYKKEQLEQRNSRWNSVLKAVKAKTQYP